MGVRGKIATRFIDMDVSKAKEANLGVGYFQTEERSGDLLPDQKENLERFLKVSPGSMNSKIRRIVRAQGAPVSFKTLQILLDTVERFYTEVDTSDLPALAPLMFQIISWFVHTLWNVDFNKGVRSAFEEMRVRRDDFVLHPVKENAKVFILEVISIVRKGMLPIVTQQEWAIVARRFPDRSCRKMFMNIGTGFDSLGDERSSNSSNESTKCLQAKQIDANTAMRLSDNAIATLQSVKTCTSRLVTFVCREDRESKNVEVRVGDVNDVFDHLRKKNDANGANGANDANDASPPISKMLVCGHHISGRISSDNLETSMDDIRREFADYPDFVEKITKRAWSTAEVKRRILVEVVNELEETSLLSTYMLDDLPVVGQKVTLTDKGKYPNQTGTVTKVTDKTVQIKLDESAEDRTHVILRHERLMPKAPASPSN